MGKGTINSHVGDGQYSVTLNLGRDRVTAEIARVQAQIVTLTAKIADLPDGTEKDIATLQRTACEKRIEYLNANMPSDPTVTAWCIDLTDDLTGEVGTVEIPGERGSVNIQPGYDGNAAYTAARDGQLGPILGQPPAGAFYNLAMLPGWQKWRPTYRYGTITSIDHDANTCNVTLDAATSSQQGLGVNQSSTLTDVTIGYMTCDATAFEEGDEVIVEFEGQDLNSPKVIGFKEEPKPCGWQIKLTRGDGTELIGGPEQVISVYINVYDSNENQISTNREYDVTTGYWSVTFETPQEVDENGYWLDFVCEDGIASNYPYRYKAADKHQPEDLVGFGTYEDTIPYWKLEEEEEEHPSLTGDVCWEKFGWEDGRGRGVIDYLEWGPKASLYLKDHESTVRSLTVYSSVPYRAVWEVSCPVRLIGGLSYWFGGGLMTHLHHNDIDRCEDNHTYPGYGWYKCLRLQGGPIDRHIPTFVPLADYDGEFDGQIEHEEYDGEVEGRLHTATVTDEHETDQVSWEHWGNLYTRTYLYTYWRIVEVLGEIVPLFGVTASYDWE